MIETLAVRANAMGSHQKCPRKIAPNPCQRAFTRKIGTSDSCRTRVMVAP